MPLTKKSLAVSLSRVCVFNEPEAVREQYPTDSETAADFLWNAFLQGDIKGRTVADLGAGTGILGIGALLLGAERVVFVEESLPAASVLKRNTEGMKNAEILVGSAQDFEVECDTVIQNPPFGTRDRGADILLLKAAFSAAPVVYSMHKTATRVYVAGFAASAGYRCTHAWDYRMPLKATLAHHRRRIHRIKVSVFRFVRDRPAAHPELGQAQAEKQ